MKRLFNGELATIIAVYMTSLTISRSLGSLVSGLVSTVLFIPLVGFAMFTPAAVFLIASAAGVAGALICLGFVKDRDVRNEII